VDKLRVGHIQIGLPIAIDLFFVRHGRMTKSIQWLIVTFPILQNIQ
jgi:hypothetical protein